jgi:hypothetical protein
MRITVNTEDEGLANFQALQPSLGLKMKTTPLRAEKTP